ncbi:hypothetical protein Hhel01_00311 [Haloferula helveola]
MVDSEADEGHVRSSGVIRFEEGLIRYEGQAGDGWELALSDVVVIGECTNQNGPFADDWFLCFATGPREWYEVSGDAGGYGDFLHELGIRLGEALSPGLFFSTDFASVILWPGELRGRPMFRYAKVTSSSWLMRLLRIPTVEQRLSGEVSALCSEDRAS